MASVGAVERPETWRSWRTSTSCASAGHDGPRRLCSSPSCLRWPGRRAPGGGGAAAGPQDDARSRWQQLTPEQRQALRERYERWKALPEDEKARLSAQQQRLRSLPRSVGPAGGNWRRFRELPEREKRDRWSGSPAGATCPPSGARRCGPPCVRPERLPGGAARFLETSALARHVARVHGAGPRDWRERRERNRR